MQERLLGGLTALEFLRRHWQKAPLLVRRAAPEVAGWPAKRQLFGLAQRADTESRLISHRAGRWSVRHGPVPRASLARLPRRDWTLLVNDINLHCRRAELLLRRFAFLPQARLDDVMVSFAVPGGGVGAHWDSYDVFLLQGSGRRVWRIEPPRDFAPVAGAPLKLIADFRPHEEYLIEPGDLLYLPPGWGHEGVALSTSRTFSIGFRAPRQRELAAAFLDYLHERGVPDRAYRDPGLRPAARPARIERAMVRFAERAIGRLRWSRREIAVLLGRHLTAPKQHVVFEPPGRPVVKARFLRALTRAVVALDARTQLLYLRRRFFVNGDDFVLRPAAAQTLARLADRRSLGGGTLVRAGLADLIYDWYLDGYLFLERDA